MVELSLEQTELSGHRLKGKRPGITQYECVAARLMPSFGVVGGQGAVHQVGNPNDPAGGQIGGYDDPRPLLHHLAPPRPIIAAKG